MKRRSLWALLGLLVALVLLVPTAVTVAYFTSEDTAETTAGGMGRWCAVPTPETHPNVYRLQDMAVPAGETTPMIIVPVVNNGEFGPATGSRHLGVRLWACNDASLTDGSNVKVTAWRGSGDSSRLFWLTPEADRFADLRLDPRWGLGEELSDLHREGTQPLFVNPDVKGEDRSRYIWLVSSGRTKELTGLDTSCSVPGCMINIQGPTSGSLLGRHDATFGQAFQNDTSTTREPNNAVTYLGNGYWKDAGTFTRGEVHPAQLLEYPETQLTPPFNNGAGPAPADGNVVQWVVIEWWGDTEPTEDMVIEVFLQ